MCSIKPLLSCLALVVALFWHTLSQAQTGTLVSAYYSPQISSITNASDGRLSNGSLTFDNTTGNALGAELYLIFSETFGFRTGLALSNQGQRYSGFVDTIESFTSEMRFQYLKVPLLFSFTASAPGDRIHFSMGAGLQGDYLLDASFNSSHKTPLTGNETVPDLLELYNRFTLSMAFTIDLNFRLSKKLYLLAGVQLDRTIGGIENRSFTYAGDEPLEWYFPVGIPKVIRPRNDFHKNEISRYNTKNSTFGGRIGLIIKLAEKKDS